MASYACRYCKDTGEVALFSSRSPCLDCEAHSNRANERDDVTFDMLGVWLRRKGQYNIYTNSVQVTHGLTVIVPDESCVGKASPSSIANLWTNHFPDLTAQKILDEALELSKFRVAELTAQLARLDGASLHDSEVRCEIMETIRSFVYDR